MVYLAAQWNRYQFSGFKFYLFKRGKSMPQSFIKIMRTVVLAGLVVLCGTIFSGAQETRATVSGSIQDPNGAVIPGAKVTARNIRTGVITTATAAADGNYTI